MNAICFDETGDAELVLKLREVEKPRPGAGEVLLKMIGSTINPADFLFIGGNYRFKPQFPQIAGLEGAGIVEATGAGVDLPPGTLAAFLNKETWAEYAVVPVNALFILPQDFPVDKAVQFALNPVTAWGLLQQANLKSGDYLLLSAGGSTVAKLIARLAVLRGINVIATVRNSRYKAALTAMGVSVINTETENVQQEVHRLTNGKGAACVLDPVGGETGSLLLDCLGINGKLIIYGKLDPEPALLYYPTVQYKNLTISAFGVRGYLAGLSGEQRTDMVRSLTDVIGGSVFEMEVAARFKPGNILAAVKLAKDPNVTGKVILKFTE